jgi:hypothetical protein
MHKMTFITLEDGFNEFIKDKDEYTPDQLETVRQMYYVGACAFAWAMSNIKEACGGDEATGFKLVAALFAETREYARDSVSRDEVKPPILNGEQQKAWPFPTGAKN